VAGIAVQWVVCGGRQLIRC